MNLFILKYAVTNGMILTAISRLDMVFDDFENKTIYSIYKED